MNAEDRERFRQVILQQIERSKSMGITLGNIAPGCHMAGFKTTRDEIEDEITRELIPAGFVILSGTGLSQVNVRYLATGEGRNYLLQHGLA